MILEGLVKEYVEGKSCTGIGTFIDVQGEIWEYYPVDLSCENKYIGYIMSPDWIPYHVISGHREGGKILLVIRKVRKDRKIT